MNRLCAVLSFLIATSAASGAENSLRSALQDVAPGSTEATAILEAQIAWMAESPFEGQGTITLEPLVLKRNDRFAYLVARVSGLPRDQFIDAILELQDGHWVSYGYQGLGASPGEPAFQIKYLCGFGAGVSRETFIECGDGHAP